MDPEVSGSVSVPKKVGVGGPVRYLTLVLPLSCQWVWERVKPGQRDLLRHSRSYQETRSTL